MVQKKINLCFVFPDGGGWTGETNYLKSLISSLSHVKNDNFNFYVICSYKKKNYLKKFIKTKHIIASSFFENNSILSNLRKMIKKILTKDIVLNHFLKKYKIHVISHYEPNNIVPTICWIPDLQHLYLKSFFTKSEVNRRNKLFNNYIKFGKSLIVSSNDSYSHLKKNYSIKNIKTFILNFVPKINFENIKNFNYLREEYNISKNYVYIPNQFWKHKNHLVLIKCANLLKKKKLI